MPRLPIHTSSNTSFRLDLPGRIPPRIVGLRSQSSGAVPNVQEPRAAQDGQRLGVVQLEPTATGLQLAVYSQTCEAELATGYELLA